ncbi:pyruvate oxidase [Aureibacillus halotolerans]|uniref:Pyruvate oxidase n=1 Tax=Aureibacillus halotolerans TaxID=1508390 RepID=A0A4V3D5K9_9BACI|nr:pyruvate oxidase [Aureibacillus halotolerans]TDQ40487.1 pyruvate oxidase [Aureibacillus halotolerans]
MSTTAADHLVQRLKAWNISHIYGMPGDSINNVIESLRKTSDAIDFIQIRHEETGALAAAAYAKLTGKIGACLSIGGPGAIHLLNGLYDAKNDSAPVLAIIGQVSSESMGRDAFQEVALDRLFNDVAVYCQSVTSADSLPDIANQAIRTAYAEKGVAVIIVPDDIAAQKLDSILPHTSVSLHKRVDELPPADALSTAIDALSKAKKPVILAGKGAMHARKELEAFADHWAAPVIVSFLGKGVIPDEHPFMLGHLGQIGTKPAYEAMEETDLLIMVGTSFPYRDFLPDDAPAIQIDNDPTQMGKRYPITCGLLGDAKTTLKELIQATPRINERNFLEACQKTMEHWRAHLAHDEEAYTNPILAHQVVPEVQRLTNDDAVVSIDVGNVTVWAARHFKAVNHQFVSSGWLATMGCGLPGAIAAKIAYPERQVIAFCGDGGFAMGMQDFLTAVKYELPMLIIVMNNEVLGMIKYEQQVGGHLNEGIELHGANYAKFAEACGGEGYRVETRDELRPALEKAVLSKKPTIVDVVIKDQPPLPGKINVHQALNYSKYLLKEAFENHSTELPPLKKSLQRFF